MAWDMPSKYVYTGSIELQTSTFAASDTIPPEVVVPKYFAYQKPMVLISKYTPEEQVLLSTNLSEANL